MRLFFVATLLAAITCSAHAQSPAPTSDPLAPLQFLIGTWSAQTGAGTAAANASGNYTFRFDLNGHAIERTSSADHCRAPQSFDCVHHDRLTIFSDPNAMAAHQASLLAFYLDSEGHVIYYTVALPDAHTAVFDSQGPAAAPKFRLVYHLEGEGAKAVMSGKFQMAAPGSSDYHSYLEWSGTRQ